MKNILLSIFSVIIIFCSCGVYTFSPSALGGVKTIAIPQFENTTTEYGIDDFITTEVNQSFVDDNTLKIVPEDQADIILIGVVSSYSHEPYTFDETETVKEYVCRISLKIKMQYSDLEKVLWEDENLSDYGVYSIEDGLTQDDGNELAIKKLVDEIMNRTVKGW